MNLRTSTRLGASQGQILALLTLAAASLLLAPLATLPGLAVAAMLLLGRLPRLALAAMSVALLLALAGLTVADSQGPTNSATAARSSR